MNDVKMYCCMLNESLTSHQAILRPLSIFNKGNSQIVIYSTNTNSTDNRRQELCFSTKDKTSFKMQCYPWEYYVNVQ